MRLDDDGDRSNVEDRRGSMMSTAGLRLGLGGTLLLLALSVVFKHNMFSVVGNSRNWRPAGLSPERTQAAEEGLQKIAILSFNDSQRVWAKALKGYRPAKLVLFWDETRSGCGSAGAAMGPFYCPVDEKVYIDLGFYRELATRFRAPGQFAQAYVIAHEVGHHLQNLLGIEPKVRAAQRRQPSRRNALSVRMELQADCFAGVWGRTTADRHRLDPGEIDQGLAAAAAVGDDRLQKAATGRVHPETFTHGSAAQRVRWFRRGFESGQIRECDTFRAASL